MVEESTPPPTGPKGVLAIGAFGSGKTSVIQEIADVLEERDLPYAALDLDWLAWFHGSSSGEPSHHRMLLTNLADVVENYLAAGVRFFVLARSLRDRHELDQLRGQLPMRLTVVGLNVPLEVIEKRLSSNVTSARSKDLAEVREWIATSSGLGIADMTVENDRPLREVATDILDRLAWLV